MKVTVSYQTLQLPPPFAFAYTIDLYIDDEVVKIKFEQEYLNRDTLSEDEIIAEGFTSNDDFKWEGKLDKVWADHLGNILEEIPLQETSEEENLWIHFSFASRSGLVSDTHYWDYELQELVQAIYETSGRENKMKLEFRSIEQDNPRSQILKTSFEKRMACIDDESISWEDFRKIISLVYNHDYHGDGFKKPKENGLWIDLDGSGIYYIIDDKSTKNDLLELLF